VPLPFEPSGESADSAATADGSLLFACWARRERSPGAALQGRIDTARFESSGPPAGVEIVQYFPDDGKVSELAYIEYPYPNPGKDSTGISRNHFWVDPTSHFLYVLFAEDIWRLPLPKRSKRKGGKS
jgi:hypothetical protein